jgi:hypothetical protein
LASSPIFLWKTFFHKDCDVELLGICKGGSSRDGKLFSPIGRRRPLCKVAVYTPAG